MEKSSIRDFQKITYKYTFQLHKAWTKVFKRRLQRETSSWDFSRRLQCDGCYVIEHITLSHNNHKMKSSVRDFMKKNAVYLRMTLMPLNWRLVMRNHHLMLVVSQLQLHYLNRFLDLEQINFLQFLTPFEMYMKGENILTGSNLLKIPSFGDEEGEGDFSGSSVLVIAIFLDLPLRRTADPLVVWLRLWLHLGRPWLWPCNKNVSVKSHVILTCINM